MWMSRICGSRFFMMWRFGIIVLLAVLSVATGAPERVHAGFDGRVADDLHSLQISERLPDRPVASSPVAPSNVYVQRLGAALEKYRAIARQGGWDFPENGPKLETGSYGAELARLRARLAKTGDIAVGSGSSERFDDELREGVLRFQARHGLRVDGIVGRKTRAALSVSVQARIDQIAINMRRWRSMPADLGRKYILVNVPGQELFIVERDRIVFASRVIVGRVSRPTPLFASRIVKIVVNPHWYVPRTIAVRDILPKLKRDSSYLTKRSIRVYRGTMDSLEELAPAQVDWRSLSENNFPYRLIQDPGPKNSLGRIKFYAPNAHDAFLHDTPHSHLFEKVGRALSSGCIRVKKAEALARYMLGKISEGSVDRLDATLEDNKAVTIPLKTSVPLYVVYSTAWVNDSNAVEFREDIYGLDKRGIARMFTDGRSCAS